MTRADILQETNKAKAAHEHWIKRIEHLISGLPVDKGFIPSQTTECGFGKWLYSQGEVLRTIRITRSTINEIEHYHDHIHQIYGEICKLYFIHPQKRNFLYKIVTFNRKKITNKEKAKAKNHFTQMKISSEKLLELLARLQKESEYITYKQFIDRS